MCTGVTKFFHIDSTGNLRQRGANQKYMKQKMKLGGTRCKLKTEKTEKGQLSGTWCNSVVIGANKKYLHQVPPSCTQLHPVAPSTKGPRLTRILGLGKNRVT